MLEDTEYGQRPKVNILNGLHYTPKGDELLAKEIQKSLYGHNLNPRRLPNRVWQPCYSEANSNVWTPSNKGWSPPVQGPSHVHELRQILATAMTYLPHA